MRSYRAEKSPTVHRTLTTLGIAGFVAGAALFGVTGAAVAETSAASCSGSVAGKVGEAVMLKSAAVEDYVVESVRGGLEAPLLGIKNEQTRMREAFEAGKFEPISLTKLPNKPQASFTGAKVAEAVLTKLDSNDKTKDISQDERNREKITEAIVENCGLTLKATDYVAPQSATTAPPAASQPGGQKPRAGASSSSPTTTKGANSGVPGSSASPSELLRYGSGDARAPRRDYGGLPFAMPGTLPGGDQSAKQFSTPGLAGDLGVLGTENTSGADVSNAGNAEAIEPDPAAQTVQLPMLLAVVALAGVAAALVRTWVLRNL